MRVIKKIIRREEKNIPIGPASSRGNKTILRGLYYVSPWIRDLQACKRLCDHFCEIAGEPLVPHPSFCNSPQVCMQIHIFCKKKDNFTNFLILIDLFK